MLFHRWVEKLSLTSQSLVSSLMFESLYHQYGCSIRQELLDIRNRKDGFAIGYILGDGEYL